MKNTNFKWKLDVHSALLIAIILALPLSGYVAYQYRVLNSELEALESNNRELSTSLSREIARAGDLLSRNIEQEGIINSFQGQISEISSNVGTLEKLARTDEELLRKYSKVYFLNENYQPAALTEIDEKYLYTGTTNFYINAQVWPHLRDLLDEARGDDVELLVASAYRSFGQQATLKNGYTVLYGSGANQFSADQGYSEHQLGTSIDFTTLSVGGLFSQFKSDPAYKWLTENAHKYGFILSYPEANTYYKFEPWHWRYVGVDLATYLHEEGKYFYDLDQRQIDKYLIKLFD